MNIGRTGLGAEVSPEAVMSPKNLKKKKILKITQKRYNKLMKSSIE